ncbi:MAG TPA: hypothetical protein VFV66_30015 [Nonomuraea sp.]|nr:hypothetical protein [Nonomuraea sp.]
MSKFDVARLREPAAWIMCVAGLTQVLVAIGHILIASTPTLTFANRAAAAVAELTSPVVTALLLGAVLLVTKIGEPSSKAKPIASVAAAGLLLGSAFGMLSLLAGLFAGNGIRPALELVLVGVPTLALMAVALVYLIPQVLPERPVAQVYHHPQFVAQQPPYAAAPQDQAPPAHVQQPPYGPGYAPQPPSGQQPGQQPGYAPQPPSGQQPGYGQQPPSFGGGQPEQPPYVPPAEPQPQPQPQQQFAQPQQPESYPPVRGALPAAPSDQPQSFGTPQPEQPQGFGQPQAEPVHQPQGFGQDPGFGQSPGFGQDSGFGQSPGFGPDAGFGAAQSPYAPADTTPNADRPAVPDYHTPPAQDFTPPPAQDYATPPAPDYSTPPPQPQLQDYATPPAPEYSTPPAQDYQPAPYVPADSQPSVYSQPSPNPYAPPPATPEPQPQPQSPYAPTPESYSTPAPAADTPPNASAPYYGQNAFDQQQPAQQGGSPFTGYSGAEFATPAYQEPDPPVDPRSQQLLDAYQQAETYQTATAGTAPDLRVPDYASQPRPYDDPFGHSQQPHPQQQNAYEPRPYRPTHQAPQSRQDAPAESTARLDPSSTGGDPRRPGDEPIDPTAIYTPNEPRR